MSDRQEVLERVRGFIVDILALDPDEATPDKRFFQGLGGESIELLELQFRLAKEMGIEMEFSKVFDRAQIKPNEQGVFGPESIAQMRKCYPFLPTEQLPANPKFDALLGLLTVESIGEFVWLACLEKESKASQPATT